MRKKRALKNFNRFFFLLFAILLLLVGQTSIGDSIKYPFSYFFTPIYVVGNTLGKNVLDWKNALINASSYIEEYNQMKEEIARLKIENSERLIDYEQYLSLKEHHSVINLEGEYIEAKILSFTQEGDVVINGGANKGIEKGDLVVLGKVYIGTVSDVGLYSSLVRLPTNKASSFEVVVLSSKIDLNKVNRVDSLIKSDGVIIGGQDTISIENMGINSSVEDGDIVLIRDERVNDILIVGTLIGVSKNPASTHKNGFVQPIFDYSNILTVFVKKDADN